MSHYNFETTSQFLSKFCIPLQCNQTRHSLLKRRDVQELGSKFVKFLMGILKQQVNSPSNFAPFLIVRTHESPVKIKLIHFLFWIKGSHQNLKFEIFKCSGKHLSYSSSHFPNHESVFLQTFHHSLVSVMKDNFSALFQVKRYILCSKETSQSGNFENFEFSDQGSPNFCHF